jgi:CDP-glucose 4,6-dehydratase
MDKVVKEYLSEFYRGRKVLITGHTGFKGSWLCMYLNHLGAEVYGYSLDPPTDPNLYSLCSIDSFVKSCIADIRIPDTLIKIIDSEKPDVIFHMAAQALVRKSYVEPVATYMTNVTGTINLLEALRVSKASKPRVLVNVTTDKCYENKEWHWPYRENEPLGGYDPYSNSKACSELVTSSYRNSFFNTGSYATHKTAIGSARAGNVIGGGDWAQDRLIPDIIRSITDKEIIIIRNPDAIRPWQHVLEPLTGYLILGRELYFNAEKYSGAWNFGPAENDVKTVKWITEYFCRNWPGANFEIKGDSTFHEATYLKLDCSKAHEILDWHPRWKLEKALHSIIEFTQAWQGKEDLRNICLNQIEEYLNN